MTRAELVERIADEAREVILDGLRVQQPDAGDGGVSEEGFDYERLADRVLALIADGAEDRVRAWRNVTDAEAAVNAVLGEP